MAVVFPGGITLRSGSRGFAVYKDGKVGAIYGDRTAVKIRQLDIQLFGDMEKCEYLYHERFSNGKRRLV